MQAASQTGPGPLWSAKGGKLWKPRGVRQPIRTLDHARNFQRAFTYTFSVMSFNLRGGGNCQKFSNINNSHIYTLTGLSETFSNRPTVGTLEVPWVYCWYGFNKLQLRRPGWSDQALCVLFNFKGRDWSQVEVYYPRGPRAKMLGPGKMGRAGIPRWKGVSITIGY